MFFNSSLKTLIPYAWVWEPFSTTAPSIASWLTDSLWQVFRGGGGYGPYLWTMSIELPGSYLLFATLGLVGEQPKLRILVWAVQAVVWSAFNQYMPAFFVGAILCEMLWRLSLWTSPRLREAAGLGLLALAYLESALFRDQYAVLAAAALVLAVVLSPTLKFLLRLRFSRFLGRVSFPLYLVHCFVIYGPSSWAILRLHEQGLGLPTIAAIVAPLTVLAALILAWITSPIETAGKNAAHWTGKVLAGLGRQNAARPVAL